MARSDKKWYRLDNAAKIIPSTAQGADTRVFRISCELKEEVDAELLQESLDETIREFPQFRCYLKKGIFWYYLEQSPMRVIVKKDEMPALSALYYPGRKKHLFRLTYYRQRINLEVYHVLADGAGAFQFFRQILSYYLRKKHGLPFPQAEEQKASLKDKTDDAFSRFYQKQKNSNSALSQVMSARTRAYQLRGEKDENLNIHLLEACVSASAFKAICKQYDTSITILTTAIMIEAIIEEMQMRERKKAIVVTIPVNLRNYFPTETTRNFFGAINVVYRTQHYDGTLESVIADVRESFQTQLTEENIQKTMNTYAALEHNWAVKVVPLQLKDLGIQGLNTLRRWEVTTSVSNVGRVTMPEDIAGYIDRFAGFMSTQKGQMVIFSYEDRLVFGITSAFKRHPVMMNFIRKLTSLGLSLELATNDYNA